MRRRLEYRTRLGCICVLALSALATPCLMYYVWVSRRVAAVVQWPIDGIKAGYLFEMSSYLEGCKDLARYPFARTVAAHIATSGPEDQAYFAVVALYQMEECGAMNVMEECVRTGRDTRRLAAAAALVSCGRADFVEQLLLALDNGGVKERRDASGWLWEVTRNLSPETFLNQIRKHLDDPDDLVRDRLRRIAARYPLSEP